jgi:hypothetical protein
VEMGSGAGVLRSSLIPSKRAGLGNATPGAISLIHIYRLVALSYKKDLKKIRIESI